MLPWAITMSDEADQDGAEWAITMSETCIGGVESLFLRVSPSSMRRRDMVAMLTPLTQ
jgi:hypothetical protein